MMGIMANNVDQRRMIDAMAWKHKIELETLENSIMLKDVGWQNFPQLWSLCSLCVWWCHIGKKWPLSKHETHIKNDFAQYTSWLDEQMKACMLEVHMAMTGS